MIKQRKINPIAVKDVNRSQLITIYTCKDCEYWQYCREDGVQPVEICSYFNFKS